MPGNQGAFSQWYKPQVLYISASQHGLVSEVVERLSRRGWSVALFTPSVTEAFQALEAGQASVLLIEDSEDLPAGHVLRAQLSHPVALLTPTLVACSERLPERAWLKEMGNPEIIDSPINPMKFIESLEWLIRRWSTGHQANALEVQKLLVAGDRDQAVEQLTRLANAKELATIVAPCMARFLRHKSEAKALEKILLTAIRENPRNVGVILATIDFYLHVAMPSTALKIINATKKNHGNPAMLIPEHIQALVMLNEIDQCIPLLEELLRQHYLPEIVQRFLSRCHFAEGHTEEFLASVENKKDSIHNYNVVWQRKTGESA